MLNFVSHPNTYVSGKIMNSGKELPELPIVTSDYFRKTQEPEIPVQFRTSALQ